VPLVKYNIDDADNYTTMVGYRHQRADERHGNPPQGGDGAD